MTALASSAAAVTPPDARHPSGSAADADDSGEQAGLASAPWDVA